LSSWWVVYLGAAFGLSLLMGCHSEDRSVEKLVIPSADVPTTAHQHPEGIRVRPPGPEPPRLGTDRIPGFDESRYRLPPPMLPDVVPGSLVEVPGGPFIRGGGSIDSQPQKTLSISSFFIEKTEVSVGQFKRFVMADGYTTEAFWSKEGWAWKTRYQVQPDLEALPDTFPVVNVSFYEAEAYSQWAGRRLPSEAEWEKAARGPAGFEFPWGDETDPVLSNHWLYKRAMQRIPNLAWPVASARSGASPHGVLHMAGNVWEWTRGSYYGGGYEAPGLGAAIGRMGSNQLNRLLGRRSYRRFPPGIWKTVRGGSWMNLLSYQRTHHREPVAPWERRLNLGFRCVIDHQPGQKP